jgi:CheY-like chemotaxis protein
MSTPTPAGKTVLVVEDNATARAALADLLQPEGFAVVPAANGKDALVRLGEGLVPDLILLDLLMPVVDGWAFLQDLRRGFPGLLSVPIIVTTAVGIASRE